MDMTKPYKGRIINLRKIEYPPYMVKEFSANLGYLYGCQFLDHPQFAGRVGHTSLVVAEDGDEIETLNTRYTRA